MNMQQNPPEDGRDGKPSCSKRHPDCPAPATTTVTFPRAETDREESYCDYHLKHLLDAGVKIQGTRTPP